MPIVLVESFVEKWMTMKLEKFKLFLFQSPSIILLSPSYLRSRIKGIKTLAFRYSSTVKIQKSYARHLTTSSFKRLVRDDFLQIMLQLYQHSFPRSPIIGIALEWCSMPLQKKKKGTWENYWLQSNWTWKSSNKSLVLVHILYSKTGHGSSVAFVSLVLWSSWEAVTWSWSCFWNYFSL